MQPDIALGAWVIPGIVATAVSAIIGGLWSFATASRIKALESSLRIRELALESRLKQQDEAFRLAHSPRVSAAVRLWACFCEFERCLRAQLSPMRVYNSSRDVPGEAGERAEEDQRLKQEQSLRQASATAWEHLKLARDEAEVLLPGPVIAKFDELFKCFSDAHLEQWSTDFVQGPGRHIVVVEAARKALEFLTRADGLRPLVVEALRVTIEGPSAASPLPTAKTPT